MSIFDEECCSLKILKKTYFLSLIWFSYVQHLFFSEFTIIFFNHFSRFNYTYRYIRVYSKTTIFHWDEKIFFNFQAEVGEGRLVQHYSAVNNSLQITPLLTFYPNLADTPQKLQFYICLFSFIFLLSFQNIEARNILITDADFLKSRQFDATWCIHATWLQKYFKKYII